MSEYTPFEFCYGFAVTVTGVNAHDTLVNYCAVMATNWTCHGCQRLRRHMLRGEQAVMVLQHCCRYRIIRVAVTPILHGESFIVTRYHVINTAVNIGNDDDGWLLTLPTGAYGWRRRRCR